MASLVELPMYDNSTMKCISTFQPNHSRPNNSTIGMNKQTKVPDDTGNIQRWKKNENKCTMPGTVASLFIIVGTIQYTRVISSSKQTRYPYPSPKFLIYIHSVLMGSNQRQPTGFSLQCPIDNNLSLLISLLQLTGISLIVLVLQSKTLILQLKDSYLSISFLYSFYLYHLILYFV